MTQPSPRYKKSIDFLKWWGPLGPWILTAIHPDKKSIATQTFAATEEAKLQDWLKKWGTDHNLYFQVNPALRPLDKKAERTDIAALAWLHVDVDPRPREDLKAEQERALALLQTPPEGIPGPSAIVFSGGGYQGFWRLKDPFQIKGDLAQAEEAKRWNQQLELTFGADHCHSIDHVMRLPGTINRPDPRKRKKGRTPALAKVVELHDDRIYDLSQFTKAAVIQGSGSGFASKVVQVSGNVARLASVDELPPEVTDACKVVIVQGYDPDDLSLGKYDTEGRSGPLFWVCCSLVRAKCDDDVIYSVITDPDFRISDSVLDKGTIADRYARRQIQRAREDAIHPKLRELNEKHAVIGDIGGKCRIISEVPEMIGGRQRSRLTYMSFADFSNRYCNQTISFTTAQGNATTARLGKWWIHHPYRLQFETIIFDPERDIPDAYNLWRGFAYDAKAGGSCDKFVEHLRRNICCGEEEHFTYLIGWLAQLVQHPANPGQTAIVLRGKRGTGKSFFAKVIGRLFGKHFFHISDPKHLVGNFNAHLQDCVLLFADEAFYAGDRKHESVLKMLVTEEMIAVEKKGIDVMSASNFVHLIMASNDDWVVPAGLDERRFFVLDVGDGSMQNTNYFAAIDDELEDGGYECLLHKLMSLNLSEFDVRTLPKTQALMDQKILSLTVEQEWWYHKLVAGEIIEGLSWPRYVFTSHLVHDFTSYTRLWNAPMRGNATRLGRFMRFCCPTSHKLKAQLGGLHDVVTETGDVMKVDRPRIYMLPTLKACRDYWDEECGGPYDWPDVEVVEPEGTNTTAF